MRFAQSPRASPEMRREGTTARGAEIHYEALRSILKLWRADRRDPYIRGIAAGLLVGGGVLCAEGLPPAGGFVPSSAAC